MSGGTARIHSSGTHTTIDQTSQRVAIDWNSFNLNPGDTVQFVQPSAFAIALNRIHDSGASAIDGQLLANGQIWLLNPNGILFGKNSKVTVGSLLASTSDISNARFMAGDYRFTAAGSPSASVVNDGSITVADAGLVTLVAPNVVNNGSIQARFGKVSLASGDTFTVDPYGDGLINLAVSEQVARQLVENNGTIAAEGGQVTLRAAAASGIVTSLINNTGLIEADTAGNQSGQITLLADSSTGYKSVTSSTLSDVRNSGTLKASGYVSGQKGGLIEMLGGDVTLSKGGRLDASGDAGGGTIRIGGDFHGKGPTPTASIVTVEAGAVVSASAVTTGNGGKVSVWSDSQTAFGGLIEAKGGSGAGNGGMVETSGKQLAMSGTVDASAHHGRAGTWLLDPATMNVVTGGGSSLTGSTIDPTNLVAALNGTNVTLQADNSITVTSAINASGNASGGNLTLNAPTDYLNAAITLKSGSTLSGVASTVNVGANGMVQNGVDAAAAGGAVNLAAATYGLNSQITIAKSLTLNGDAANGSILNGQHTSRVMEIDGTSSGITVNLNNLTMANGNGTGTHTSGWGGALYVYTEGKRATVSLSDSLITGNSSTLFGGGIFNDAAYGGNATMTITRSTIANNSTVYGGGGISNDAAVGGTAPLSIDSSTISGNAATNGGYAVGGGVFNFAGGVVSITNSTLAGNSALNGGAIYNQGTSGGSTSVTINSSTVSNNMAASAGGGIYNDGSGGAATLGVGNTILGGNQAASAESDYHSNAGSLISNGFNLYGRSGLTGGFVGNGTTDRLLGTDISAVLRSLGNYGGPTATMALLLGSVAIDAGNSSLTGTADGRGILRGTNAAGTGLAPDIGAYEMATIAVRANDATGIFGQPVPQFTYTVNSGPIGALSGSLALVVAHTEVGNYLGDIGQGTLGVSDSRYSLNFIPGQFTIDPAASNISLNLLPTTVRQTTVAPRLFSASAASEPLPRAPIFIEAGMAEALGYNGSDTKGWYQGVVPDGSAF